MALAVEVRRQDLELAVEDLGLDPNFEIGLSLVMNLDLAVVKVGMRGVTKFEPEVALELHYGLDL